MSLLLLIPALMFVGLVWLTIVICRELLAESNKPRPTYYVQHPDGTFTKADPQPR